MHRYLVERTFGVEAKIDLPGSEDSTGKHVTFTANNAHEGVVWIYSYLSPDCAKSFCIYDAPNPEAVRRASMRNSLPVDRITEVRVLSAKFQDPGGYVIADLEQAECD